MRRAALSVAGALCAAALWAPGAGAFELQDYRMSFEGPAGEPETQAGAHPFAFTTSFGVQTEQREVAGVTGTYTVEAVRDLRLDAPPGLVAVTDAVPRCATLDFLTQAEETNGAECADSTVVGETAVEVGEIGAPSAGVVPVYSLAPPPGAVAEIGFWFLGVPVTVDLGLSESPPYNGVAIVRSVSQVLEFFGSVTTLWGVPADPAHDPRRGRCLAGGGYEGPCPAGVGAAPFVIAPRACPGPLPISWTIDTWAHPAQALSGGALAPAPTGCERLGLAAGISARPTARAAQSPSGLDFGLDVHDEGIANPNEGALAGSDIRRAEVALPPGMTVNPSQAEGLEACTEEQYEAESPYSAPGEGPTYTPPGAGCPEASKIGAIEVETPLLEAGRVLKGSLYVAEPYANPTGSLIAVYVVIADADLGVVVRQPIEVRADPHSGRLLGVTEDMPQLPFSHFRLHFREGGRAPLISPPGCGDFQTTAKLYPWSGGAPLEASSSFQIVSGPDGSPCPTGAAPFDPGFEAGTESNAAGSESPFDMRITRKDAEQDLTRVSAALPPGVVGKIAGVPYCPEAGIAAAQSRSGPHGGAEELADPSCPRDSRIGRTLAGAGAGNQLTYVGGALYLAGPWHGGPLSIVSITPAVAGPFDAGVVVVRFALALDPRTGEVQVDGSASDPIPHILKGIPLDVRDLRAFADRPGFTRNATGCEEEQTRATLWSGGTVLGPLPDAPMARTAPYRAASCGRLRFDPRLALSLKGGTRRGDFPALRVVLRPRKTDSDLQRLSLRFPHSEFIEQGHFRTICTRVQFAAGPGHGSSCPKGSVYGHAEVFTPLLDYPLTGPVFLRSSNHNLPDAVLALHGPPALPIQIEVPTRIDSVHGGLRAIAAALPDAPVSRAVVNMRGGQKGLFVNSTGLCGAKHRARLGLKAHNGRLHRAKPLLRAVKCAKRHRRGHHRSRGAR